jgi:hypothetical protein
MITNGDSLTRRSLKVMKEIAIITLLCMESRRDLP